RIKPDWRERDDAPVSFRLVVDGEERLARFGQIVDAKKSVIVKKAPGYRVNAIGWNSGKNDESDAPLVKKNFKPSYSLDRAGNIFRVEVYRDNKFAGMFLLRFGMAPALTAAKKDKLPDLPGKESSQGF
nr:deacylase [Desulfovibrio sp.]